MLVLFLLGLAKKKGRRKMGRYIRGNVDEELSLGTLAGRTLVSQIFDDSVNERTLITSIVATWTLSDMTDGADIGPILVGVAHSDYTATEMEEFIENTGSWDEGNLVSREVANRKVRMVGQFGTPGGASSSGTMVLGDGKPIKTKLNWILNQGQTLDFWAYNLGDNALATTVPILQVEGHANLFPK